MKKDSSNMIEPNYIESDRDDITLVQITDTHLFAEDEGELLGVNTLSSFSAVVADIENQALDYDALIMTGDVSQDHTDASYANFEQCIAPLKKPCYWLPGNHDYQPSMKSVYPSTQIQQDTHLLVGKYWQVILLDSQAEGSPHGFLTEQQLQYLSDCLSEYPDRFSLVLLHHHPLLVGSQWLDQHCLHNSDAFWKILEPFNYVKAVLCGHVHQDFHQVHQGVEVLTSPSTCIQFKPQSNDFALDKVAPGWRSLILKANGQLDTKVYRLEGEEFLPNFEAQGY
ncbi:3',5'-cyclic adenosine monophosphate phosphodiesterase CpdA [Vibrio algivorus]|uniref:3',5'-cyclic adenosine monophosphate phosphodiesterase CpdA n=2 Tax=Vibrio algivorus TaxID=1667024 RepID=A0ABQ6ER93_9VIBR|nr:3',5'-cyclic adenosine monophosphate phosphodiesterase CpdA [Vibrio algivorus]